MASSRYYRRMESDDSLGSEDQPPSVEYSVPPDECLMNITNVFISIYDSNIPELEALIKTLGELTDGVERIHRNTTIASLSGGVIGAIGGITSIVGLILTPFTLGASLIVTGVGIGVATAGGLTGAGSNITDMVHQRFSRSEIEKTLKAIQDKLSPIIECVKQMEHRLGEIQRSECTVSLTNIAQTLTGIGRGLGYAAEGLRLINFLELSKVAAQASRAVKVAGAITGVFSSIFLLLDIVFIVKDAKELSEIDKQQKDGNERSGTVKFIQEMRKACDIINQTVNEIRTFRNHFQSKSHHPES